MRTLAITENMSADGSLEFLGDWFDPTAASRSSPPRSCARASPRTCLLLGRQTFTDFRGFWPLQTDDTTGITALLNRVHKVVVSTHPRRPRVGELHRSSAPTGATGCARSRRRTAATSSSPAASPCAATVIEAGLVDEYRLFVHPAVQGRGRRLFPEGSRGHAAAGQRAFENGVVLLVYARA